MKTNTALQKLRAGKTTCGFTVGLGSPEITEFAANLGFDWTWIEWQHGSWTEESLRSALAIFLHTDTVPIVRVRGRNDWEINKVLDMGAMGVIIPMVNTPEEAELVCRAAKFTPKGTRSGGGTRLPLLGEDFNSGDYFSSVNDEIIVVVMIETVRAVERAEEIMSVPGIDVILPGPGDLLMDVKANGGDEAERDRLVDRLLELGKKHNIPVGYVSYDVEMAKAYASRGFQFVTLGQDRNIILDHFRRVKKTLHEWM